MSCNAQSPGYSIEQGRAGAEFHHAIRKEAAKGHQLGMLRRLRLNCIANVDQTPLPFTFTNGSTYESKGASTVWVQGGSSGLDKRQCTVKRTLFADGNHHVNQWLF